MSTMDTYMNPINCGIWVRRGAGPWPSAPGYGDGGNRSYNDSGAGGL